MPRSGPPPIYVFLHMAHTGGSTLGEMLKAAFPGRVQTAYGNDPPVGAPDIVYGHTPRRYEHLWANSARPVRWVTFLRHPFGRQVSAYWLCWREAVAGDPQDGHTYRWPGFEDFLLAGNGYPNGEPPLRTWIADYGPGSLAGFDYVGCQERWEDSVCGLERRYGWQLPRIPEVNAGGYAQPYLSARVRARFAERYATDIALYQQAVAEPPA